MLIKYTQPKNLHRIFEPNSYYHVFNRGNHKKQIFHSVSDYEKFLIYQNKYFQIYDTIDLLAWCLMPNHFHLLVKTGSQPQDLIKLMQQFMTAYAVFFNKKYNQVGHLFQSRYHSRHLRYEHGVQRVYNYIKRNPVEAELCRRSEDYKWLWLGDLPFYAFEKENVDRNIKKSKF